MKQRLTKKPGRVLFQLSLCNLVGLLLLQAVWHAVGERHWLLILLLYLPQPAYLAPASILLFVSIWVRRHICTVVNACSVLLVLVVFMRYECRLPGHPAAKANLTGNLRVLTFNIHCGTYGVTKIANYLKHSNADVIFLQEVKQYLGAKTDPAPTLIAAFPGWQYARGYETLILSRFPLGLRAERPLGPFRNCLTCRMRLNDRWVRLINVHLNTSLHGESLQTDSLNFRRYLPQTARVRNTQVEALLRMIEEAEGPCIVAGDFNSPPNSFVHRAMTQRFHDCFEQSGRGLGFTFRSDFGLWRIDYIFLSREFTAAHCKTGSTRVSDHRPVWGEVYLP